MKQQLGPQLLQLMPDILLRLLEAGSGSHSGSTMVKLILQVTHILEVRQDERKMQFPVFPCFPPLKTIFLLHLPNLLT